MVMGVYQSVPAHPYHHRVRAKPQRQQLPPPFQNQSLSQPQIQARRQAQTEAQVQAKSLARKKAGAANMPSARDFYRPHGMCYQPMDPWPEYGLPFYNVPNPARQRQHLAYLYSPRPGGSHLSYMTQPPNEECQPQHERARVTGSRSSPDISIPLPRAPSLQIPPMAFKSAAQKLDVTLRKAIEYFASFHNGFKQETKPVRRYVEKELADTIWRSKIKHAEKNPAAASTKADNLSNTTNDSNNNYDSGGQEYSGNDPQRNQKSASIDHVIFSELAEEVYMRCEVMCNAVLPIPQASSSALVSAPNLHGEPVNDERFTEEQLEAAQALLPKIQRCREDLIPLLQPMRQTFRVMERVLSEMRGLRHQLHDYQFAWRGDAEESSDGGWGEDHGDGRGSGN